MSTLFDGENPTKPTEETPEVDWGLESETDEAEDTDEETDTDEEDSPTN